MDIRLAALDLDGTALTSEKTITAQTRAAASYAARRGIDVVISTGRTVSECGYVLQALPQVRYMISTGGARVIDLAAGKDICGCFLPLERAAELVRAMEVYDSLPALMTDGKIYCQKERFQRFLDRSGGWLRDYLTSFYHPLELWDFIETCRTPVEKLFVIFASEEEQRRARAAVAADDLFVTSSSDFNLEYTARGADKGQGLAKLAAQLGLTARQVCAVGDSENDREMLEYAGLPVAMGNAGAEIKKLCRVTAPGNDEDGVAWVLKHLADKEELPWN